MISHFGDHTEFRLGLILNLWWMTWSPLRVGELLGTAEPKWNGDGPCPETVQLSPRSFEELKQSECYEGYNTRVSHTTLSWMLWWRHQHSNPKWTPFRVPGIEMNTPPTDENPLLGLTNPDHVAPTPYKCETPSRWCYHLPNRTGPDLHTRRCRD